MAKRRIISVVGAVLALGVWAAPAASADASDNDRNPIDTGCTSGAYAVASWPMVNTKYNQNQGTVQLMYSPGCQTNWINVYGNVSGNVYEGSIFTGSVPGDTLWARVTNIGSDYSLMKYAPGNTCVTVGWDILDGATGNVEGNDSRYVC